MGEKARKEAVKLARAAVRRVFGVHAVSETADGPVIGYDVKFSDRVLKVAEQTPGPYPTAEHAFAAIERAVDAVCDASLHNDAAVLERPSAAQLEEYGNAGRKAS